MNAIQLFQKKNSLNADGIIGKITIGKMMEVFELDPQQVSNFLGQLHHETMGFHYSVENLNYSEQGLLKTFGKYFDEESAKEYARNPEKIANVVYANRMGNGDTESGEGWKYRGRGAIQLTGKNNYTKFSESIGNPQIIKNPDLVATKYYFDCALWYFKENSLLKLACYVNDETTKKITKKINGGYNGLEDRINKVNYYYNKIK